MSVLINIPEWAAIASCIFSYFVMFGVVRGVVHAKIDDCCQPGPACWFAGFLWPIAAPIILPVFLVVLPVSKVVIRLINRDHKV